MCATSEGLNVTDADEARQLCADPEAFKQHYEGILKEAVACGAEHSTDCADAVGYREFLPARLSRDVYFGMAVALNTIRNVIHEGNDLEALDHCAFHLLTAAAEKCLKTAS